MASLFATVSEAEILAVNEAAASTNTKKRQNLACWRLLVVEKKVLTDFAKKIIKMIAETLSVN